MEVKKMKKQLFAVLLGLLVLSTIVSAWGYTRSSSIERVYLEGSYGERATLTYSTSYYSPYSFYASGLEPGIDYRIILYRDNDDIICVWRGDFTSWSNGRMWIRSRMYPSSEEGEVMVVLAEDVDCRDREMVDWNPQYYLFEA
jgi:hypothetical protein